MKPFILLSLVFTVSIQVRSQKMPSDYFEEGINYSNEKEFKKSIESFKFIVENHPNNELYPKSLYNLGYVYYQDRQLENSIQIFTKVLKGGFNEKEPIGGDIMDNIYANFKHQASSMLSEIYYVQEKFDSSLHYYVMADTVYPFIHFCGNAYAEVSIQKSIRYSEIYTKLNQLEKAVAALMKNALGNSYSDNSEVLEKLKPLLKGRKDLKNKLDEALTKIYSKSFKGDSYNYKYYYFTFLETEFFVPGSYETDDKIFKIEQGIEEIKSSDFYRLITEL